MAVVRDEMLVAEPDAGARPEAPEAAVDRPGPPLVGDRTIAALLFAAALAVRLPFRAEVLVNWDAVNFALGVDDFDLRHHQPHPPGYLGYVLLARGLRALVGDTNAALTLISAVAGALAPALLYLLARRFAARGPALGAAVLFATAPLAWYYSTVALSYALAGALALGVAVAAHRARTARSTRALVAVAVLLAVIGAIRPTDMLLLAPLGAWAAWGFAWRDLRLPVLAGGLVTAAWLVPLLWVAGGPLAYLEVSSQLAVAAGERTFVLASAGSGLAKNLAMVGAALTLGLFAAVPVLAVAAWRGWGRPSVRRADRWFLWLWVVPSAATYLLVHTGQLGYVLIVLPAAYLVLARALARVPSRRIGVSAIVLAATANAVGFAVLPGLATDVAASRIAQTSPLAEHTQRTEKPAVPDQLLQFDVRTNDVHWQSITDLVRRWPEDATVVLALPQPSGSFRHAAYYLPDRTIYGVGPDAEGRIGHLVTAEGDDNDYEVARLARGSTVLVLPVRARHVFVLDEALTSMSYYGARTQDIRLPGRAELLRLTVPPGSVLEFTEGRVHVRPHTPGALDRQ